MRLWFAMIALVGCWAAPGRAEIVAAYGYPFDDPLVATVIGTPVDFQAELPERIPFEDREIYVFPRRRVPSLFWYTEALQYGLSRQPGPAPLAFLIPGTGATYDAPRSMILQKALYKAGFHVVSLPSTIHPNFIVSASSSMRPGLLTEDAEDVYRVLQLIRAGIGDTLPVTGYHLIGYSLGATQAAFVAKLDADRKAFGFEKVLLVNPPVNLYRSAAILDSMFNKHFRSPQEFNAFFNQMLSAFSEVYGASDELDFSSDFLYEVYKADEPDDETLEALIGLAFRLTSINLLFTSDVMSDTGVIVPKGYDPAPVDPLAVYFKLASVLNFTDYARRIVFPYYHQVAPQISFEELTELASLRVIEDYLRTAHNIRLVHNLDDLTLGESDIDYLIEVFGDRARIYPDGGHCGNMAYRDNVDYVIDYFSN